jgi:hypothetical protein
VGTKSKQCELREDKYERETMWTKRRRRQCKVGGDNVNLKKTRWTKMIYEKRETKMWTKRR